MDIRKYEALLRAVDLGSFSAAANELGYTPAGISHMVNAIEDELNFAILKRGHNGVSLTHSGKSIIDDIRNIVNQEHILRQRSSDITGLLTGTVTIGSYYSVATQWMPTVFREFLRDHPGVNIELREGGHQLLNRWMIDSTVDFCINSHDGHVDCKWFTLREDPMVIAVPTDHPFALKTSVTLDECCNHPFIMPACGQDFDVTHLLKKTDTKLNIRFTTVENYSALAMVEKGLGISIMNKLITQGINSNVILVPLNPPQSITLGIAVSSMRTASPAAKKLISYIRKIVAQELV